MASTDQSPTDEERRDKRYAEDLDLAPAPERRRLYRLAFSILRDQQEAEAAVKGALHQAWKRRERLERTSEPAERSDWLTGACLEQCFARRAHSPPRPSGQLGSAFEDLSIPGRRAGARALARGGEPADADLDAAYRRLPVKQRAALSLHYHYGYTIDQCSKLTGWRTRKVRSLLDRAVTRLREELDDA